MLGQKPHDGRRRQRQHAKCTPSLHVEVSSCQLGADAATASGSASSICASSTNVSASSHEDNCAVANSCSNIRMMGRCASGVHALKHCRKANEQPTAATRREEEHET